MLSPPLHTHFFLSLCVGDLTNGHLNETPLWDVISIYHAEKKKKKKGEGENDETSIFIRFTLSIISYMSHDTDFTDIVTYLER